MLDLPGVAGLPVVEALPRLLAALDERPNALLVAPPGAGKTTLVPLALRHAGWRGDGRILVLEPRRLAARAAATRMAALIGEKVGHTVGFRTRLDSAVSDATRIEVVTEGLLVRRLSDDPGLAGVAAVLLDEIHERSLDADLALALCRDLQRQYRPELRLLAMSATPDAARIAALLDATVIESAGIAHEVRIIHADRDLREARDLPDAAARAVRAALAEHVGDILVFLPGMGEIRRAMSALSGCGALLLPLHGDLPASEQDRALRPAAGRRVVLATSIAETSLTVPGVRVVIDGGWRRTPRFDAAAGLTRLATVRISRAAAAQRAGRAGREAPGVAIRPWTAAAQRGLAPFDPPEIEQADLAPLALACADWGASPADLPFPDQPPTGALAAAMSLLHDLGALDPAGKLTDTGRALSRLGAHPRLGAMMLAAETPAEAAQAAEIAALLEERDPIRGAEPHADIGLRLAALAGTETAAADGAALSRIRRVAGQYRRRLRLNDTVRAAGEPGRLLAAGFPDRIAQRRGEPGSFRLAGGGSASLPRADPLASAKLLAVATMGGTGAARIRLAALLDTDDLPASVTARITETVETSLDPAGGAVLSRRRRRLGALVLADRTGPADPTEAASALAASAARDLSRLPWTDAARQLQARVALMRGIEPDEDWPDLSDPALAADATTWLQPHLHGFRHLDAMAKLDLSAILRAALPGRLAAALDRALPPAIALPGGRVTVDYTQPVPTASARAQAFYGLARTPTLAGGCVALQIALLSPAGRPVAITADLAGFWTGAWQEVRREMRGRYPRHAWPENPAESPSQAAIAKG